MDFKTATNELCDGISHKELAEALGVSVATIRQARLRSEAHRSPPENWEDTIINLAGSQIQRYRHLISELYTARQHLLFPAAKRRKGV